ncbi:MAG TPA: OmpH family outer membrane protein, partial [Saprospiraceae bacterium]|nr:OmpH family outer membrane protein [Saprospiraceae bacterium]
MKFKIVIALLFFFAALSSMEAQKFGHINSALLIQDHPKVSSANKELESFQKLLTDSFSIKVKAFEDKYKMFMEQSNTGTLSAVAIQTKQAELKSQQESLATEEEQLQFRLVQRREQLLKPILAEID